ncbi:MAG: ATP-binding protein, partial [Acidobacteriia bacterium]|nr:ATP-binding protein [Terriglobia bacterium]
MRYTRFEIHNFKGIEKVRLDLARTPRSRVHTLIGLNESGKTTVLEAIDRWAYRESLDALSLPGYEQPDVHELIPIAKRSNFNDAITIEAVCELESEDQTLVKNALKKQHNMTVYGAIQPFTIKQSYKFSSSRIAENQPQNTWTLAIRGKLAEQQYPVWLKDTAWQQVANVIKTLLPRIVYFPNFLFDFPDRIYLENAPADELKHAFYRAVLQDVLDAIGDKTNLPEHVLARAKSGGEYDKKALESVLLKMGAHITKTVFSNWDRIFHRPAGTKEIVVTASLDNRGVWFLQLRLKEGNEHYDISERSLGFRWFFTYLLLTQYRGFRKQGPKDVVFLFDEPASNLHPSAQTQLLDSFRTLPEGCTVIYTTHSHHLIKPEWLDGAFVVRNEGLHYAADEDDQYTAKRTLITVTRYREFAVQHPQQTTYFQPVLDVLDYRPTLLENVPDVVMLEGKSDFFAINYMAQRLLGKSDPHLLPGTGSGSLDSVIRLYVAWGRNFVVLLDSD